MSTTEPSDQQQRTIDASLGQPFRFEQGASLHVGILGMVGRPSGPHDEAPYVTGTSHTGRSQCELDLSQLQDSEQKAPALRLWFDPERTALDISAAFEGAPAGALDGSGIPSAVVDGPVSAERGGDAGDGVVTLLMQMCSGKVAVDPDAMLRLIASEHLQGFAEHDIDDKRPVRAFNARMSIEHFLQEVGLTTTTLVNQIAVLGYDLRRELGPPAIAALDEYLSLAPVELAWFIDESDRVHAAQVIVTLTDFITQVFTSEQVIAQIAAEERSSIDEVQEFVEKSVEAGRLVYVHAIWQTFDFDPDIAPQSWPDAIDLTAEVADQSRRLQISVEQEYAARAGAGAAAPDDPAGKVTIDPDMIEQMRASSGGMYFALTKVDGDAVAALHHAQTFVQAVRHPDEPNGALASYVSDVVDTAEGAHFWADISDMEEETEVLEELLDAVVSAVASVVNSAHLSGVHS
ncbi:MAG: hypothetical protein KC481_18800 [Acidimicrobiaceae bacterium]|nr:hypothetical protein [Acidimicrobiaceae bacterium]